jgi:hypothetical protein
MHRFIDGEDRMQQTLLPNSLEDYVSEESPVRVIEVFIDELDLAALGFAGMTPAATGRPAYAGHHGSGASTVSRPASSHRRYRDWTHERIRREAALIGSDTAVLVPAGWCPSRASADRR